MEKVKKIKKITLKGYYKKLDFNKKDKLLTILGNKGMSYTACFYRFTRDGFKVWEYEGIDNLIKEFSPDYVGDIRMFWDSLISKKDFMDFMETKAMSRCTVSTRFSSFNFKDYEIVGIKKLVEDFENERTI